MAGTPGTRWGLGATPVTLRQSLCSSLSTGKEQKETNIESMKMEASVFLNPQRLCGY